MARKWTEEEKKAFGEKMKQKRLEKLEREKQAEEKSQEQETEVAHLTPSQEAPTIVNEPTTEELLKRALEAIDTLAKLQVGGNAANTGGVGVRDGRLVGTIEKYSLDPDNYPDPTDRLAKEPRLARFAFDINYGLEWVVSNTHYETKDGLNYVEPKFELFLYRVHMDPDTGEPTNKRYVIGSIVMHEDPQMAMIVARNNGIKIDEENEKKFLNEMRYIQLRDWLLEMFYPPKSSLTNNGKELKEEVVGGKVVQFFEINSQDSSRIPFDEIDRKF